MISLRRGAYHRRYQPVPRQFLAYYWELDRQRAIDLSSSNGCLVHGYTIAGGVGSFADSAFSPDGRKLALVDKLVEIWWVLTVTKLRLIRF